MERADLGVARQAEIENQSLQGIANMIGPGLFTYAFALAIRPESGVHLPGTPFVLAALLVLAALAIAWRATRPA